MEQIALRIQDFKTKPHPLYILCSRLYTLVMKNIIIKNNKYIEYIILKVFFSEATLNL